MSEHCPICGARLGVVRDAHCPGCGNELDEHRVETAFCFRPEDLSVRKPSSVWITEGLFLLLLIVCSLQGRRADRDGAVLTPAAWGNGIAGLALVPWTSRRAYFASGRVRG
jgi:hypothetical protein